MVYTVREIANYLGAELEGNINILINAPAKISDAAPGTISFISNPKYESKVYTSEASAIVVNKSFVLEKVIPATLVRVNDVNISMLLLFELFSPQKTRVAKVSEQAHIHESATIGEKVNIGEFTVVEAGSSIGNNCNIYPQVYIGQGVQIGEACVLYPGVRIEDGCVIGNNIIIHSNAVIGSDGFGFVPNEKGEYQKVKHIGKVIIEDNVEIGSNTVIDRATIGATIIREGVKLDNLIQIAHNVEIKKHTVIAAQAGVAGSSTVGAYSKIGGQVGIVGHIELADKTQIQAQSGIASSIKEENSKWYGSPAIAYRAYLKSFAIFKKLPSLYEEIRKLKKQVNRIHEEGDGQDI